MELYKIPESAFGGAAGGRIYLHNLIILKEPRLEIVIFDRDNQLKMENSSKIRWVQRFGNFEKSLTMLQKYVDKKNLGELEKPGLIKLFETTFEQAWLTIKNFYEHQGETGIQGSRDAFRMAFQRGLIFDGASWMDMIESRKLTVHTYDEKTASIVEDEIMKVYYPLFNQLKQRLQKEID